MAVQERSVLTFTSAFKKFAIYKRRSYEFQIVYRFQKEKMAISNGAPLDKFIYITRLY